jgi:predicted DNA binding protein
MSSTDESTAESSTDEGDILRTAVREGYFGVPREVSLADLAEQQGVSDREASEQLRDGVAAVLRDRFATDDSRGN